MQEVSAVSLEKEPGVLSKIIGVFISPRKSFESVDRKPNWVAPVVILLLFSLVASFAIMDVAVSERMEEQREKMIERGMSPTDADAALEKGMAIGKIAGYVFAPVGTVVTLLIVAGVLLFAGNVLLGGESTFKKAFAMYSYASLIGVLGFLLKIPLILQKQTMNVHFSLATFLPADQSKRFVYLLLSKVEIFSLWQLAVVCIGMGVIYHFHTKKAATVVVPLWAVYAIGSAAIGSLF